MTMRNRLLFIFLMGATQFQGVAEEATRPVRTAPDQPALRQGVPVEPAPLPKRRFNERITFHQTDPLLPPKPSRKGAVEPEPEPAPARAEPRMPRPFDPVTDAPRQSREEETPTEEEIQKALRERNWLDPARFQSAEDRADRRELDRQMGLSDEEEETSETEETESGESRSSENKGAFGDYFDQVKKEAEAMSQAAPEKEPEEPTERELEKKALEEKKKEEQTDKRNQRIRDDAAGAAPFAPVSTNSAEAKAAAAGKSAEKSVEIGSPTFTPLLPPPSYGRTPGENQSFQQTSRTLEGLGLRSAASSMRTEAIGSLDSKSAPSLNPVTGSFRSMEIGASAPSGPTVNRSANDGWSPAAGREAYSRPGGAAEGGAVERPSFFSATPPSAGSASSASFSPPTRSTVAPPPGTGFQSGFSSLRSSALLPPAVDGTVRPTDRWEKDRLKSTLMDEGAGLRPARPGKI